MSIIAVPFKCSTSYDCQKQVEEVCQ